MEILKPQPVKELIEDLNRRMHEIAQAANEDIQREEERSREWCQKRWRRVDDETRHMRAQRDAMLKAWSDSQPLPSIVVSSK